MVRENVSISWPTLEFTRSNLAVVFERTLLPVKAVFAFELMVNVVIHCIHSAKSGVVLLRSSDQSAQSYVCGDGRS